MIYELFNAFDIFDNYNKKIKILNIKLFDSTIQTNIKNILNALMRNALYNNINGPKELIIYLDGIIESMDNKYNKGTIPQRIKSLRDKKGEQFYEYYNDDYTKEPVLFEGQKVKHRKYIDPKVQIQEYQKNNELVSNNDQQVIDYKFNQTQNSNLQDTIVAE